jgi:hypothetical protein
MIILSSSKGDQKSLPYHEKKHGIFTYYFLKKIQETKGKVSYTEMDDYLLRHVSDRATLNNFIQTPQLMYPKNLDINKYKLLN